MSQRIQRTLEVEAPVQKVYDYWETLENLPRFMSNIEEVSPKDNGAENLTHWSVKGPFGKSVEFDAKTTQRNRNESIAWNSVGGDVETSGRVLFKEVTPNRTRLDVTMNYWDVPGGKLGEVASQVTGGPETILEQDLKNFKDIMEERATVEEVQQRPSAAKLHSGGVVAFLTSGTGLLLVGGAILAYLLLRGGGDDAKTYSYGRRGIRFTVEL